MTRGICDDTGNCTGAPADDVDGGHGGGDDTGGYGGDNTCPCGAPLTPGGFCPEQVAGRPCAPRPAPLSARPPLGGGDDALGDDFDNMPPAQLRALLRARLPEPRGPAGAPPAKRPAIALGSSTGEWIGAAREQPVHAPPRPAPPAPTGIDPLATIGRLLASKAWTDKLSATLATCAAKEAVITAKSAPSCIFPHDAAAAPPAGVAGGALAALFGSSLGPALGHLDYELDMAALATAMGQTSLAPLEEWAARADPLAALVASGVATARPVSLFVAARVRDTSPGGVTAVTGVAAILGPAILAEPRSGIARDAAGAIVADTTALRDASRAAVEEVLSRIFSDAGARLNAAAPAPPARAPGAYDNVVYALACAGPDEPTTLAQRTARFAVEVAAQTGAAARPGEVAVLLLAAALAADTLFVGAPSAEARGPVYVAQRDAIAASFSFARSPMRGLPHGADEAPTRAAILRARAAWAVTYKGPGGGHLPPPRAPAPAPAPAPGPAPAPPAPPARAPAPAPSPAPTPAPAPSPSPHDGGGGGEGRGGGGRGRGSGRGRDDGGRGGRGRGGRGGLRHHHGAPRLSDDIAFDEHGDVRCRAHATDGACFHGDVCTFSHRPADPARKAARQVDRKAAHDTKGPKVDA